jgi:hypothetical protein
MVFAFVGSRVSLSLSLSLSQSQSLSFTRTHRRRHTRTQRSIARRSSFVRSSLVARSLFLAHSRWITSFLVLFLVTKPWGVARACIHLFLSSAAPRHFVSKNLVPDARVPGRPSQRFFVLSCVMFGFFYQRRESYVKIEAREVLFAIYM